MDPLLEIDAADGHSCAGLSFGLRLPRSPSSDGRRLTPLPQPPYTPPSAALHPSLSPPPPASPGTPPTPRTDSAGESLPRTLAAYAEQDHVPDPHPVVAALHPPARPHRPHHPRLHQVVDGRHPGADEVLLEV